MEKIKLVIDEKNSVQHQENLLNIRDKINEIIRYVETLNIQKVTIDRLIEEDRLQTLEDKVKFIMENNVLPEDYKLGDLEKITLKDLWDERKKDGETIHNACKTIKDLGNVPPQTTNLTKEEIMEEFREFVAKNMWVDKTGFNKFENWLSKTLDKLNVK